MQSLLLERATGQILPMAFATTVTEAAYASLAQASTDVFPEKSHSATVNALAIEQIDNRYILSGCSDSTFKLWDLQGDDGAQNSTATVLATVPRKTAHSFGISAMLWWPHDTGMFFTASFDHCVKVWDTNAMEAAHAFDLGSRVYAIDLNGSQKTQFSSHPLIAVASDQPHVRLLDIRSASSAHTLPGHKGKTLVVAWHPQNAFLLASGGHDGEAKVWDIRRSKSCLARLDMTKTNARSASVDALNVGSTSVRAHLGPVNAVVWDELGHLLYTAGNDDKVRVWDVVSTCSPPVNRLINYGPLTRNKYIQTLPMVLSPRVETEAQYLLFASDSGYILVYRALDGKLILRLLRQGLKSAVRVSSLVYAGSFSATYFAGCQDGDIVAWRPESPPEDVVQFGASSTNLGPEEVSEGEAVTVTLAELYDDPYFHHHHKGHRLS